MSISTHELDRFSCCIDESARLIGDTFGDEMLKSLGVLEPKLTVLDCSWCSEHVMALGGNSNGDLSICGMGLSGELRPDE